MIRLLFLLECDQCEETWPTVVRQRGSIGIQWDEELQNLEFAAEEAGWSGYRGQHACDSCVMEAMSKQNAR